MGKKYPCKKYPCGECDYQATEKSILTRHQQSVHMYDENVVSTEVGSNLPCSQCEKTFRNKTQLTRHEAVHSGIKFNCDKCSSTFSRKDKLNAHMRKKHLQLDCYKTESLEKAVETDEYVVEIDVNYVVMDCHVEENKEVYNIVG